MNKTLKLTNVLLFLFSIIGCSESSTIDKNDNEKNQNPPVINEDEDNKNQQEDREIVDMQLINNSGIVVKFDKKGAKIDSIEFDKLKIAENGFIAGRVANRIANGKFDLDGKSYTITKGMFDQHTLHGGEIGFDDVDWTKTSQTGYAITFELDSPDGDQGFPGNLHVSTTYTLSDDGELSIEYRATSDAKTLFNPTNHLYMNMNGVNTNTYKDHSLWIDADSYTKTKSDLIPTGEIVSVSGTTLDYTTKREYVGNNDSNLVLNGSGYRKVAELSGNKTNIQVEVSTDRVGLQLYNDNGHICLEAQDYPDAINHANFPSIVLEANSEYYSKTSYKFSKSDA